MSNALPTGVPGITILAEWPSPGAEQCGLTFDGLCLWHSDFQHQAIFKLEPTSGAVIERIDVPKMEDDQLVFADLAFDGVNFWQLMEKPKKLICLGKSSGRAIRKLAIEPATEYACGVEFISHELFWLAIERQNPRIELRRVSDGQILRTFSASGRIAGLAIAAGLLWYTEFEKSLLVAVNPDTGVELARFSIPGNPTGISFDGEAFIYADYSGNVMRRFQVPLVQ